MLNNSDVFTVVLNNSDVFTVVLAMNYEGNKIHNIHNNTLIYCIL